VNFSGISESSGTELRSTSQSNLDWQAKNLGPIQEWLEGEETGETSTLGAGSAMISTVLLVACAVTKFFL
jgi:hypothetical protein